MSTVTPLTHYKALIDAILGPGLTTFNTASPTTNNVIGAIADSNQYREFCANFRARLKRLAEACKREPSLLIPIKNAVNQIADPNNWDGAYAELVTLDFLMLDTRTSPSQLTVDVTLPASQTLASEMRQANANLDVYLRKFETYLDTKLLSDKSGELLKGIIAQALKAKGIKSMTVLPTYNADMDFEIFQKNRMALVNELTGFLDVVRQPRNAVSTVVHGLTYAFGWKAGGLMGVSTYDPAAHAANHHTLLFKHAKKFHLTQPSLIAFVHFPWASEKLSPFSDGKVFYSRFAELFFESYENKPDLARQFNSAFQSKISAFSVTKKLSAILYLEDDSIQSKNPDSVNVHMYYFINENADNPVYCNGLLRYLHGRGQALSAEPRYTCARRTWKCLISYLTSAWSRMRSA